MAVAAFLISGMSASNAMAATAPGQAEATVVTPITIVNLQDLNFGGIVSDPTPGTVTVSAVDGTSTATVPQVSPPSTARAVFDINGDPNRAYNTNTSDTSVSLTGPGAAMSSTLVIDRQPTLDGTGNDTLGVGGVLSVGANQVAGAYSGTFNIVVNY